MTVTARAYVADLATLVERTRAGLDALAKLPEVAGDVVAATPVPVTVDEAALAGLIRSFWGKITQEQWDAIAAVLHGRPAPAPTPLGVTKIGLTAVDFAAAAANLGCQVAQIRAVDEVESHGGWFQDVRGDILALDGPGGFLDGPDLPKILFEAQQFHKFTGGKFDASAPNISSPTWNRALYVGGQGEYVRLWKAIELDREAALKSASVGRYQIMGFNFAQAGFDSVEDFWDAMKTSEAAQLAAFVRFILKGNLTAKLRAISGKPADCTPFAVAYNGVSQAQNNYAGKIAAAYLKFA